MKIHLRKRIGKLSPERAKKGKKLMSSLYLAYQIPKQKVKYEWLDLHVFETPKTNLEKEHNKETMLLAESIRAKKLLDAQATRNGFVSTAKGKISFLQYFETLVEKKYDISAGNHGNWKSTYEHLCDYCKGYDYTLEQIDEIFLEGFKDYLLKHASRRGNQKLHVNSASSYFCKVKAALKEAYMNKMIKENPCNRVRGIKAEETSRQYLVLEELRKLAVTPCENEKLKKAFLFSAFTGLRWSDVKALTWDKIKYSELDGWSLHFKQKKTKAVEVLPASEQAIKILGDLNQTDVEIFEGLLYNTWMNSQLQSWVNNAGISKKITFHCARHSFATLQLSMDTDIYTVSKLLGHKNLKTTQIYAKITDKKKIEAAKKLSSYLDIDVK